MKTVILVNTIDDERLNYLFIIGLSQTELIHWT